MASSRKSKSNDLIGCVADALLPAVPAGVSIVAGLSGGMDSVVLLHLLARLAPGSSWRLSALHVHHGISLHADDWAVFCARFCASLGVPFHVEHVDIRPIRHMGIEAAARQLRHQALARQSADFVALAHHQDDQAETMLLQLLRGAGVRGLAAMAPATRQLAALHGDGGAGLVLLRPLLDVSRAELAAYAEAHNLQWVEDESNADEAYPRNFLRHRVMPLLERRFPACPATLARSARHFAEADALLEVLAEQDAQGAYDGETLAAARLGDLDALRARNLLRWFLRRRGALMPETSRLEEMLRQVVSARQDTQVCVTWGEWQLRRYRGRVHVCVGQAEPGSDLVVSWAGEADLPLPGGVLRFVSRNGEGVDAVRMAGAPVTVRWRRGEEKLRPDPARPARSLRYLFQEHGIPPWQRPGWPLLYCGERLIAVPGLVVDHGWLAPPGSPGLVFRWDRGGKP